MIKVWQVRSGRKLEKSTRPDPQMKYFFILAQNFLIFFVIDHIGIERSVNAIEAEFAKHQVESKMAADLKLYFRSKFEASDIPECKKSKKILGLFNILLF